MVPELGLAKEYGIKRRYTRRGPPYHMIVHALQTVLNLNKKYFPDVHKYRVHVFRMGYCIH